MIETIPRIEPNTLTGNQLVKKWSKLVDRFENMHDNIALDTPEAIAYCAEQATKAKWGVDFGTGVGGMAWVMLTANPLLHLWCVDDFNERGSHRFVEQQLEREIRIGRCEIIVGDSRRASEMLGHMKGKLHFVWFGGVKTMPLDLKFFRPLIKPGGCLFGRYFHDGDFYPYPDTNVREIWSQTKKAHD